MLHRWTRRSVIASGLALAGCALFERPKLGAMYADAGRTTDRPPLVLIPGAFGSSLRDRRTRKEVWPASDPKLLLSNYRGLELRIDDATLEPLADDVEAYDIFREGLGQDFYGHVLDTLQRVGGYRRCLPGQPPASDACPLYVYPYDFRLDNVRAARGLEALIQQIRIDLDDPSLKVDVVAHSNGGLLVRYYARYGAADLSGSPFSPTYAGAASIRRLLLVGPPNLGTLQPVLSLLRGEEVGLRHIPIEVMASCPGVTQMMPHPSVPWLVDMYGHVIDADLYDIATWRDFRWSLFDPQVASRAIAWHGGGAAGRLYLGTLREYLAKQLLRGKLFSESLAVESDPELDVRPWVFGGDCELTPARLVAESVDGDLHARERPRDIVAPVSGTDYAAAMFEPGDTVVTRSSLLGHLTHHPQNALAPEPGAGIRVAHSVFLCERHQQLTGNPSFQDNLLNALISVD